MITIYLYMVNTRPISNQGMLMDIKQAGMILAKGSTRNHVKGSSIDERFNDEISGSNLLVFLQ
jgi:hypothetical protein